MILLVSGEGATDIGSSSSAAIPASSADVSWGSMGRMIDRLVEAEWGFSPAETDSMLFLSEAQLGKLTRNIRGFALPDRKRGQETAYFFKNARAMARLANEIRESKGTAVGIVLFRDADGTNSDDRSLRAQKINSMRSGFLAENCEHGVPMVPQPKSEAWLLCALQAQPYQNCQRFESISGNDSSPNSAKEQLSEVLKNHARSANELEELTAEGVIDVQQIDMPSFNEFRDRMREVARAMLSDSH